MNVSDSNDIRKLLIDSGYEQSSTPIGSNIIIINTCSVRNTAEQRIEGRLGYYKKLNNDLIKKTNEKLTIILTGCMAERLSGDLLKTHPEINIIAGTHSKSKIPDLIKDYDVLQKNICSTGFDGYDFLNSVQDKKHNFKAYIPIIHGCNNYCSYCIVPYTRGREVSRSSKDIIENIKQLVNDGVIEITLLGQNVNTYGKDNSDISFAELLNKLTEINGLERIRFITSHPKDFNNDLIKVIAEKKKICKYLHLPFQSGSNKILKDMNRKYTIEEYREKIYNLKKVVPKIALSTDILVGYPTESESDYEDTLKIVEEIKFDTAFMFKYSLREGTKASTLIDNVPEEEKLSRLQHLIEIQNSITKEKLQERIGDMEEVLFENSSKKNKDEISGKSDTFNSVIVADDKSLIGKIKKVEFKELIGNTYKGIIVE